MGAYLFVEVVYGASYAPKEVDRLRISPGSLIKETVVLSYADTGGKYPYLWVEGSLKEVASEGGGEVDPRHSASLKSYLTKDEEGYRAIFEKFCQDRGVPFKEPQWLLVWGWR
jgi:hypothetical protein